MPVDYTATYDPTLPVGAVRFTLQDVDVVTVPPAAPTTTPRAQWSCLFTDQEIQLQINRYASFANANDLAAAALLDFIASNSALLAQLIRLGSYESDTRVTAKGLRDQADAIRAQYGKAAAAGADEPAEAIEDEVWDDFGLRRWLFTQH